MKPKLLPVLEMCIEDGLSYGYSRAHKHNDNPSLDEILEAQKNFIMASLYEWFDMGESDVQGMV